MGAHPYVYFTRYVENPQTALDELRQREFVAGRYNPVVRVLNFEDVKFLEFSPGAKHPTIAEACEAAGSEGTRSILDIERVGNEPEFGAACRLGDEILEELYGTSRPTRGMVEGDLSFLDEIERGQCVYFVLYEKNRPHEMCFAGYSYD